MKPFPQKFFAIMNEKLVAPITQEELKAWLHASPLALMVWESNVSHIFGTYLVKITRRWFFFQLRIMPYLEVLPKTLSCSFMKVGSMKSFPTRGPLVCWMLHITSFPRLVDSIPTNFDGNHRPKLDYFPPFATYLGKCPPLVRNFDWAKHSKQDVIFLKLDFF